MELFEDGMSYLIRVEEEESFRIVESCIPSTVVLVSDFKEGEDVRDRKQEVVVESNNITM